MKSLIMTLLSILSSTALALPNANIANSKALELLLASSSQISIDGDVHSYETLDSILTDAQNSKSTMQNTCDYTNYDNMYECTLMITHYYNNVQFGETAVIYQVKADDEQMPLRLLSLSAYISRGH